MLMSKAAAEEGVNVDLTPVIDMVFLLLIFFLVATTFQQTEREMKIALPAAEAAGPISMALREIVINIDDSGAIFIAGRQVSEDDLRTMVTEALRANPDQKISVRADRAAAYDSVARVLGICKAAGADQPFLDTVPID
jgi:biopolymer transport protein ExbD